MTWKWVIMVWLTQNPGTARHSASAEQFNAQLQLHLPTYFSIIIVQHINLARYNRIYWQQSCQGKAAAGGCPSEPFSGACKHCACPRCRHSPNQQMLMVPVKGSMEAQSTNQSLKVSQWPKQVWKLKAWEAVEDLEPKPPPPFKAWIEALCL